LNAKPAGYKDAALARFYDDLRMRFRDIPGVREVSLSDFALVSGAQGQPVSPYPACRPHLAVNREHPYLRSGRPFSPLCKFPCCGAARFRIVI
jgi:hypothetical protein